MLTKWAEAKMHLSMYQKHGQKPVGESCYYEFGSGYHMFMPVYASMKGFSDLRCLDVRRLAFKREVTRMLEVLNGLLKEGKLDIGLTEDIPVEIEGDLYNFLRQHFRINYFAPSDARTTGFESDSVDFILTNAVFEHIPSAIIPDVLKECKRVMRTGAVMSNAIDYRDHFSFSDDSISCYNYLQYSESEWEKLNPSIMYQNRLRHSDYVRYFESAGFRIVDIEPQLPGADELNRLREQQINEKFSGYSLEDLSVKTALIVVQKV